MHKMGWSLTARVELMKLHPISYTQKGGEHEEIGGRLMELLPGS